MEVPIAVNASRKELEEIKETYQQARAQGRNIISAITGQPLHSFTQCRTENGFIIEAFGAQDKNLLTLHVLDQTGDRRIVWNAQDPDQVKEAADLYKKYIEKGWKAYAINRLDPNKRGVRIHDFDIQREEIIFDDRDPEKVMANFEKGFEKKERITVAGIRQKLDKFAEAFSEIKMTPKTYPG